jgi:hypothetical protein
MEPDEFPASEEREPDVAHDTAEKVSAARTAAIAVLVFFIFQSY